MFTGQIAPKMDDHSMNKRFPNAKNLLKKPESIEKKLRKSNDVRLFYSFHNDMVGDRGIEPLTSSVSTKRSTSELTAQRNHNNGIKKNVTFNSLSV